MEHNTDRILWTVLVLAIGVALFVIFKPAANGLLSQGVEKIQAVATNVNGNKSDSSSSNGGTVDASSGNKSDSSISNGGTVDASSDSDFRYSYPDKVWNTISIVGYLGSKENLIIPQYRKIGSVSYKVTSISDHAFEHKKLTSVDLPDGLTSINDYAFANTLLTSVDLPASLKSIDYSAFANTPLTSVDLPAGLTLIGESAFRNTKLTSVDLPASLKSIGDGAFEFTKLTSVDFPASLTSIGAAAFDVTPISAISFKRYVDLSYESFKRTNLKNVTLPTGSTYKTSYDDNNSTFDPGVTVTFK